MRLAGWTLLFAIASAGCRAEAPPDRERGNAPASPPTRHPASDTAAVEVHPAPNGLATLVYVDRASPHLDVVSLVARGDTTRVFECDVCRSLGVEWLTPDLGRVWIPAGGNHHHSAVFVQASTGRSSPPIEDDVAVDAEAGTLLTYDVNAFTLRDLWSGRALASWSPRDVELKELWERCAPAGTLSGREASIRYDCGDGVRERVVEWDAGRARGS